eukprot:TRINITY_DN3997_c0_g1_i1.p2 TRINITY_DN3997_c0_g1~~TRINITY_DN3997_c0_g1_i1.p2  ORF type:complete len:545 (+),score=92.95 TRINITY_DN3997_c0_g1_i1:374-2008(+)
MKVQRSQGISGISGSIIFNKKYGVGNFNQKGNRVFRRWRYHRCVQPQESEQTKKQTPAQTQQNGHHPEDEIINGNIEDWFEKSMDFIPDYVVDMHSSGVPGVGSYAEAVVADHTVNVSKDVVEDTSAGRIPHRWQVVYMMGVAFILCNMDKVNMSVAVIPMAQDLGWSGLQRGLVSSAFFWGYSLTQIPAGFISTKIGGAMVLSAGVVIWSLGTLLTPSAAHAGIGLLLAMRVLVGLGEGLAPSAVTNVMAVSVPETERSRAVTTVFGGLDVGSVIGLIACGPLIQQFGWPSVFHVFAIFGFIWAGLWPLFRPDDCRMEGQEDQDKSKIQVPYGKFLRSPAVWAVITAHFCFNWGYYTLLAWLPSYFELALGLNVQKSSLLTLIPYFAMTLMTPLVGPVADSWVRSGWRLTRVRKMAQGIAFVGAAVCMLACAFFTPMSGEIISGLSVWLLVAFMSLSFVFSAWARAGLYCNHQDLSPKFAGALLGMSNTAGALPGVFGVTSVGILLDWTSSWATALFIPIAACQLFGFVIYTIFASSRRQPWN